MSGRTFIIGDVHGCRDELEELVSRFGFIPDRDRLLQSGDMITRGPDSLGALQLARRLGTQHVLGNQEARLLRILRCPLATRTTRDLQFLARLDGHHHLVARLVRDWPLWREEERFFLVHAGMQPGIIHPANADPTVVLNIRTWNGVNEPLDDPQNPPWFDCDVWQKTIVFGHWADCGLICRPGFRGLDTGCATGGGLTGWCVEEDRFYHVPTRARYPFPDVRKCEVA